MPIQMEQNRPEVGNSIEMAGVSEYYTLRVVFCVSVAVFREFTK